MMSRPHTRASNEPLFECDADLERTIRRNIRKEVIDTLVNNISDEEIQFEIPEVKMAERTMKEELEPDLTATPLAVRIPELAAGVNFELKPGMIHIVGLC